MRVGRSGSLALVVALMLVSPVSGHDSAGDPIEPTGGVGPTNEDKVNGDGYSGPTSSTDYDCVADGTDSTSAARDSSSYRVTAEGDIPTCPDGFSLRPHTHYVTSIRARYDGYKQYSTGIGCYGPCTLTHTIGMSYGHKWGASISFDEGPISGTVGYDTTWTSSKSFSFSFPVASGQSKTVYYRDWMHVTTMNVKTWWSSLLSGWYEYGTAWSGKWYKRLFFAA